MDTETLRQLCVQEFSKIGSLYRPDDTIRVLDKGSHASCEYKSKRYSDVSSVESYDNTTGINFSEYDPILPDGDIGALITYVSVRAKNRNRRFGTRMVETVEAIFRHRGWGKIDVENVDNPMFWIKKGYAPRMVEGREKALFTKVLS